MVAVAVSLASFSSGNLNRIVTHTSGRIFLIKIVLPLSHELLRQVKAETLSVVIFFNLEHVPLNDFGFGKSKQHLRKF